MMKASKEAKVHTAWTVPNETYENALKAFISTIMNNQQFISQNILPFAKKISYFGFYNSLSQTILKLTAPGVPDTYQGQELWDFSLVDPDNRRPVDYAIRKRMLASIK
jgi:(1->4)-alpha-D-glucan 1-alpha-D-glucosylmutase